MDHVYQNPTGQLKQEAQNVMDKTRGGRDKLVSDFKTMITDAEELLREVAGASGDGVSVAREKFAEKLAAAKRVAQDADATVRAKVSDATATAETYVSDNPWRAVAIAASVGAVIGFLMQRR